MLGLGIADAITVLIGLGGSLATILGLAFKAGKWKREMANEHSDLKDAHEAVHNDIDYLVQEVNGGNTSQVENCPVCSDD